MRNKNKKLPTEDNRAIAIFKNHFVEGAENECWEWEGAKYKTGYGKFVCGGIQYLSHRFSYQFFKEPIKEGLVIDHMCENRKCVNPFHLQQTTMRKNIELTYERNPALEKIRVKKARKAIKIAQAKNKRIQLDRNLTLLPLLLIRGECNRGHLIKTLDDIWAGSRQNRCLLCKKEDASKWNKANGKSYQQAYYQRRMLK